MILFFSYRFATYLIAKGGTALSFYLDLGVVCVTAWYLSSYFCTSHIVNTINPPSSPPKDATEIAQRKDKERGLIAFWAFIVVLVVFVVTVLVKLLAA